jgi:hypothetical protein
MSNSFEWHREVNLKNAEARIYLHTEKGGDEGKVIWEIFPTTYSGTDPGIMYRIMQHWHEVLKSAIALKLIAEHIHNGVDVVPGTNYSPVMLYLQAAEEFGAGLRLVLSEEEALLLMHALTQAAEHATKTAPLAVATRLPRRQ